MTRSKGPTTTPTTTEERFGVGFLLVITRDARGQLLSATLDKRGLTCEPDVPRGELRGPDGSEAWSDGRVTGCWLDMPYAHECDVDRVVAYDVWVAESLRTLRGGAFWCGPKHAAPAGKLAVEVVEYGLEHALFSNHVSDSRAEETLKHALRHATPAQLAVWERRFATLDAYRKILEATSSSPGRRGRRST